MLSKKSLALSKHLVASVEGRLVQSEFGNIFSDSILYSLPRLKRPVASVEDANEQVADAADVIIESEGVSQHESAVNEATALVVEGLANQLVYCRKVVLPFVMDVSVDLMGRLDDNAPKEFTIREYRPIEFLLSDTALNLFSKFNAKPTIAFRAKSAGETDAVSLIKRMATGSREIDDAIAELVGRIGEERLLDIYNVIFRDVRPAGSARMDDYIATLVTKVDGGWTVGNISLDKADLTLAAYLVAEAHLDNVVEGTGLSLQDYQTWVRGIMSGLGTAIKQLQKNMADSIKEGRLIMRYPNAKGVFFKAEDGEIVVNGAVYDIGLQQGLSPEAVIGAAVGYNVTENRLKYILAESKRFVRNWEALDRQRLKMARDTLVNRVSAALRAVITTRLEKEPNDSFPTDFDRTQVLAKAADGEMLLKRYFYNWDGVERPDVSSLMLQIVCDLVFPFTDAARFLAMAEEEKTKQEGMSSREAFYYATIRYLAEWMVATFHYAPKEEQTGNAA